MSNYFVTRCAATLALALSIASYSAEASAEAEKYLQLPGAGTLGVFDPAVARDSMLPRTWMVYSSVDSAGSDEERTVSLQLAWLDDGDSSWHAAPSPAGALPLQGNSRWQAEVGTLFFDPLAGDWRLLFHRYLHADGERKFEHGWIAMKRAHAPDALAHGKETRFFSGARYAQSVPALLSATQFDALDRCITLSEPGAFADEHAIYLSFTCPSFKLFSGLRTGIVMLRCAQPCAFDSPQAWRVIATPFNRAQARKNDVRGFSGAEILAVKEGWVHMSVTPVVDEPFPDAYKGCWLVRFKPGDQNFEWIRKIPPNAPFAGACEAWVDGAVLVSSLQVSPTLQFRIQVRK